MDYASLNKNVAKLSNYLYINNNSPVTKNATVNPWAAKKMSSAQKLVNQGTAANTIPLRPADTANWIHLDEWSIVLAEKM